MAEYIDREAFLKWAREFYPNDKVFASAIINAPLADVSQVVRCKDCKHCRELNRKDRIEEAYADGVLWCTNQSDGVWPDDFCSYGERKEGAEC